MKPEDKVYAVILTILVIVGVSWAIWGGYSECPEGYLAIKNRMGRIEHCIQIEALK